MLNKRKTEVRVLSFSSYTLFTTTTAVVKVQYTKSNSIPGNRTIICLRNCLNESEGNPEDSENEENSNNDEKFEKSKHLCNHLSKHLLFYSIF